MKKSIFGMKRKEEKDFGTLKNILGPERFSVEVKTFASPVEYQTL